MSMGWTGVFTMKMFPSPPPGARKATRRQDEGLYFQVSSDRHPDHGGLRTHLERTSKFALVETIDHFLYLCQFSYRFFRGFLPSTFLNNLKL
jgi:hypothetical protein